MNPILLLLFVPPLIVVIVMKFVLHGTISWKEGIVQAIVPVILVAVVWNVSRYSQMADTLLLNGKVTGKEKEWTSCSHSYSCNCRTVTSGSGKDQTTRTVCDTCYEHNNDWNWTVATTVGGFTVDRVDRRGEDEPPRWSAVQIDQPASVEQRYVNYIRAAPSSLFNLARIEQYKGKIPKYPGVYDYQYVNRVIAMENVTIPDIGRWNDLISRSLNDVGAAKQVNLIVVFSDSRPSFAEALRSSWLGGKKNDILIVIGTQYPTIRWVRVYSWSKRDIINVTLRSDLLHSKTLDPQTTSQLIIRDVVKHYQRRPMSDFAYLEDEIVPPTWVIIFAMILSIGSAIGLGIFFHRNECFEGGRTPLRRRS